MKGVARSVFLCVALVSIVFARGMMAAENKNKAKAEKLAVETKPPQKPYYVWVQFITSESRIPKRILVCLPSKPTKENLESQIEAALRQRNNGAAPMSDRISRRQ